jgi:hypothetical protein
MNNNILSDHYKKTIEPEDYKNNFSHFEVKPAIAEAIVTRYQVRKQEQKALKPDRLAKELKALGIPSNTKVDINSIEVGETWLELYQIY